MSWSQNTEKVHWTVWYDTRKGWTCFFFVHERGFRKSNSRTMSIFKDFPGLENQKICKIQGLSRTGTRPDPWAQQEKTTEKVTSQLSQTTMCSILILQNIILHIKRKLHIRKYISYRYDILQLTTNIYIATVTVHLGNSAVPFSCTRAVVGHKR